MLVGRCGVIGKDDDVVGRAVRGDNPVGRQRRDGVAGLKIELDARELVVAVVRTRLNSYGEPICRSGPARRIEAPAKAEEPLYRQDL